MDLQIDYNSKTKVLSRKKNVDVPQGGLGKILFESMKLKPDSIAQIYAPTGESDTFNTLLNKSIRAAMGMKQMGVKKGDIITICSYNQLNSVVPFLAAQFLGAIVSTIDPTIEKEDIKYLLNIVKPSMIFISDNCEDWIETVIDLNHLKIITFGNSKQFYHFKKCIEPKQDELSFEPIVIENLNETAVILFSSGTTGLPKGICLSHNYLFLNGQNITDGISEKIEATLNYASLYWSSVILMVIHHIRKNCVRLLCEEFDAHLFWKYVEKYEITLAMLPPALAIRTHITKPKDWSSKSLKYICIGGSSISSVYLESIRKSLPETNVILGYGTTELGMCFLEYPNNSTYNGKDNTVGSPLPEFQFKVVDIVSEKAVGFNKIGELRVKAIYPMNGYYNLDSSDSFDGEGFMKTGDLFYYDEDFCFFMTDRIKEMFKYLSWHIVPAKLEAILEKHNDVQLAVVVGIPHPEDDNHAAAVVVLQKDADCTKEDLQNYMNGQVEDRNRLRGGIVIVKSMLYTPAGKIARRRIRDMILDGTIITLC